MCIAGCLKFVNGRWILGGCDPRDDGKWRPHVRINKPALPKPPEKYIEVPLTGVIVEAKITDFVAEVTGIVQHHYTDIAS